MADQGEGGVDASDDYDARMASERKRNREIEAEAIKLERKALERRVEKARAKDQSQSMTVSSVMSSNNDFSADSMREWSNGRQQQEAVTKDERVSRANLARASQDKFQESMDEAKKAQDDSPSGLDKLAESFSSVKTAATILAATFAVVGQAAKGMSSSQQEGANNVMGIENTLGDSFQQLGVNGEDKIALAQSGKRFKGKGDQKSYARYIKTIADTYARNGSVGPVDMAGIEAGFDKFDVGPVNEKQLIAGASIDMAPIAPAVAQSMALGFKPTNPTQTAYQNQKFQAELNRRTFANEFKNKESGKGLAEVNNSLDNQARDSVAGNIGAKILQNTGGDVLINNIKEGSQWRTGGKSWEEATEDNWRKLLHMQSRQVNKPPSTEPK